MRNSCCKQVVIEQHVAPFGKLSDCYPWSVTISSLHDCAFRILTRAGCRLDSKSHSCSFGKGFIDSSISHSRTFCKHCQDQSVGHQISHTTLHASSFGRLVATEGFTYRDTLKPQSFSPHPTPHYTGSSVVAEAVPASGSDRLHLRRPSPTLRAGHISAHTGQSSRQGNAR